jgi:molybdopterin-containing oxidoreductase family iron-sulfur binding subunit
MANEESPREGMDRRRFLTVLGVGGAGAAAVSGCSTGKVEKLIPYLVQSEDQVPGNPTWYASTCTECAAGCGLHVKTREGRAIKLEGNPGHPVNAGTLCGHGQSALQALYNPGRLKGPMARQADGTFKAITWDEGIATLAQKLGAAQGKLAVISGAHRGTFGDLLGAVTTALGGTLVRYTPFAHEPVRLASQRVFGQDEIPACDFAAAKYIISFDTDFLENWVSPLEHSRGYAASHGYHDGQMAKHVTFSTRMSLTGMNADEWHPHLPGREAAIALAMANVILAERSGNPNDANALRGLIDDYTPEWAQQVSGVHAEVIRRVAREFASAEPGLAVAGGVSMQHRAAVETCVAVNILNYVAGNVGRTVKYGAGLDSSDGYAAMVNLLGTIEKGGAAVAIVHEANPAYALPKATGFAARFAKAGFKVSTSLYLDETAALCDLLLPDLHALEKWDDHRSRAGVTGLMQPVMEPVFPTMATGDLLLKTAQKVGGPLAAFTAPTFEAHLKAQWARTVNGDAGWREALQRGGVWDTTAPAPTAVKLSASIGSLPFTTPAFDGEQGEDAFFLVPAPSVMGDGRYANRPWMLELSDPVTKITWHSWVELHPETAKRLDVREGEVIVLTSPSGSIEAPVYVYPGIHPDVLSVPIGLGHTSYGDLATGRGVNVLDLLDAAPAGGFLPYVGTRVTVTRTRRYHKVAKTEGTTRQLGRGIADAMTLGQAAKGLTPSLAAAEDGHAEHEINTPREVEAIEGFYESQVRQRKHGNYENAEQLPQWGMVIDLARCTGCSSCITACYAENNIPWVGEADILRGREMTWLRIERYWEGGEDGEPLEARVVPMLCQHCENAPCEPVCPVYAAYHTPDGLNGQVYNRCVGTRYCANNCPYKVRYFNWYAYNKRAFPEPLNLQLNPDVTVRARGVMEKCTFCVQRIRKAQHVARLEDRPLRDGDVQVACAQACPSQAMVFGNVADPASKVSIARQDRRGYHILEDLNVRPAITYLAKVLHRTEA